MKRLLTFLTEFYAQKIGWRVVGSPLHGLNTAAEYVDVGDHDAGPEDAGAAGLEGVALADLEEWQGTHFSTSWDGSVRGIAAGAQLRWPWRGQNAGARWQIHKEGSSIAKRAELPSTRAAREEGGGGAVAAEEERGVAREEGGGGVAKEGEGAVREGEGGVVAREEGGGEAVQGGGEDLFANQVLAFLKILINVS